MQDCVEVEIRNNDISGEGNGIDLTRVDSSSVKNNTIHDKFSFVPDYYFFGGNGIALLESNHNTIKNNYTSENINCGITLAESSQNMIQSNVSRGDIYGGIQLYYWPGSSNLNTIYNNKVSGSIDGIWIVGGCSDNVLKGDQTNNNQVGIHLDRYLSSYPLSGTIIDDCISNNNLSSGLLSNGVGSLITGTTANNNGYWGFLLYPGSANCTIKNSRATGNGRCDYLDMGTDNISQNNRFGNICSY